MLSGCLLVDMYAVEIQMNFWLQHTYVFMQPIMGHDHVLCSCLKSTLYYQILSSYLTLNNLCNLHSDIK